MFIDRGVSQWRLFSSVFVEMNEPIVLIGQQTEVLLETKEEDEEIKNPFETDSETSSLLEIENKAGEIVEEEPVTIVAVVEESKVKAVDEAGNVKVLLKAPTANKEELELELDPSTTISALVECLTLESGEHDQHILPSFIEQEQKEEQPKEKDELESNIVTRYKEICRIYAKTDDDWRLIDDWNLKLADFTQNCLELKIIHDFLKLNKNSDHFTVQEAVLTEQIEKPQVEAIKRTDSVASSGRKAFFGKLKKLVSSSNSKTTEPTPVNNVPQSEKMVFGRSLDKFNGQVPGFLVDALEYLKGNAQVEGIFRLSGSQTVMNEYKERLDAGERVVYAPGKDVHNVTGLIKQFLRSMPEPLLTFDLYEGWRVLSMASSVQPSEAVKLARFLVSMLPQLNRQILHDLFAFLVNALLPNKETTRMNSTNYGTVVGPNLLWHSSEQRTNGKDKSTSFEALNLGMSLQSTTLASQVCTFLVEHFEEIFGVRGESEIVAWGQVLFDFDEEEGGSEGIEDSETELETVEEISEELEAVEEVSTEETGLQAETVVETENNEPNDEEQEPILEESGERLESQNEALPEEHEDLCENAGNLDLADSHESIEAAPEPETEGIDAESNELQEEASQQLQQQSEVEAAVQPTPLPPRTTTSILKAGELAFIIGIDDYLDGWWQGYLGGGQQNRLRLIRFPHNYVAVRAQVPDRRILKWSGAVDK